MGSALYGIYALVGLYQKSHLISCVNTVRPHMYGTKTTPVAFIWMGMGNAIKIDIFVQPCRSDKGQLPPSRHNSLFDARNSQNQITTDENVKMSPFTSRRHKSLNLHGSQNVNSSQVPMNAWSHLKENNSDAESTTSRSLPGSPSGSPTSSRKTRDMPRAQSLELISSDDGDKGETNRNGELNILIAYTQQIRHH